MRNWKLTAGAMLGLLILGSSAPAYADDAARKLGRGFANVLFGVSEVPIQIQATMEMSGSGAAATYGVVKGIQRFLMREGVGIYEVLTFPIPYPKYYEPILEPEFLLNEAD